MGFDMNWKTYCLFTGIGVFILMMGILIGVSVSFPTVMEQDDLIENLCEYNNILTDVANSQSHLIETCMGKPENDLTRLEKINCTNLKGR